MMMEKDMGFKKAGMNKAKNGLGGHGWNHVGDKQWLVEVKNTVMRERECE